MSVPEAVILSSHDSEEFIECASSHVKTKGKLFKKMMFRWGEFSHPRNPQVKIKVDQDFYTSLKKNFDSRVVQNVHFPMVNDRNEHSDAVDRNLGEIVDLTSDDKGIYAYIDVRKNQDDIGTTILGASAKIQMNYLDRRTNKNVGPTLIHLASTNLPFLTDLDGYEEVAASDADTYSEAVLLTDTSESQNVNTVPTKEETAMTKEELIAELSENHGIDVQRGQDALLELEGYVALSDVVSGEGPVTPSVLSDTIVELTNSVQARDAQIDELNTELQGIKTAAAADKVDELIGKGRILKSWRDHMIDLSLTDSDKFDAMLIPEGVMEAEFSEVGITTAEEPRSEEDKLAEARARGAEIAARARGKRTEKEG